MTKGKMLLAAAAIGFAVPLFAQVAVPLIPREKIFGGSARAAPNLSPDGKWLSWLAPRDGVNNIWVAPASNPKAARLLTNERQGPIGSFEWSPDSKQVLFISDKGGAALYGIDVASAQQRTIAKFERKGARVYSISNEVKDRILVSLFDDPKRQDIYSVDLATGRLAPIIINSGGYEHFFVDRKLVIRGAMRSRSDGGNDFFRVVGNRVEAKPFEQIGLEDAKNTAPMGFTSDGRTLYWIDSRGRNTSALIAQDVATGRKTILGQSAKADISGFMTNPKTGRIEAYSVNYLKNEWVPLNPTVKNDLDFLKNKLKSEISVSSRSQADDTWIVSVDPVTRPAATYLYHRSAKKLTKLWVGRPELEGVPLAAMQAVEIKSRDGLNMVSYLTLPPGSDADDDGRPEKPVPLVLFVHGGPWSRDSYGYNSDHQWLANRGYAVLSTNFRASNGFGKKFVAAGDLQWGAKMHEDLLDAVDWAVKNGVTRRDKVAIMGPSYGGYATLAALAFTPDTFACGVDIVGPSNLNTLLATTKHDNEAQKAAHRRRMGDPTTPEGQALLKERSPLFKADQIKRPLLIGQGAKDPTVPISEADQIVDAMKAKDIPVTYVVFPDEGHGFKRPQNKIAFYSVVENFLAGCLGGRAEPIGNSLSDSTAEVRHGADYAPGVKEALGTK